MQDRPGSTLFASGLPLDTFIKHTLLNAFPKQHTSLELYTGEPGLEATKVSPTPNFEYSSSSDCD